MLRTFFTNDIATEIKCQNSEVNECERDSLNFKNFACRWLATVAQVAPFCKEKILPVLKASASAALEQCSGGDNGRMCGYQWATRTFDGKIGARQQMSALGALLSTMYSRTSVGAFVTKPGGDGRTGTGSKDDHRSRQITAASMAAAWILTLTVALGSVFVFLFMATDLFETLQRYNRRD
jgi:mannan endo-1,6-alpha-mannosidase